MKLVKMLTPPVKASITSFGFAFLAALSVQAASIAYTGANNGDWFATGNWDSQQVPTADDDVTIGNGKAVKAQTGAIAVKSLTITGTGSALYLGKSDLAPQTIATVSENLTVTEGAKLYVYAGALPDTEVFKDAIADPTDATAAIYANPTVVSVGGTFSVSGGAVVYPENEGVTGAAVFFKPKDFVLASDGAIDAVSLGWKLISLGSKPADAPPYTKVFKGSSTYYCSYAFGCGYQYNDGAGYGGKALRQLEVNASDVIPHAWTSGVSYGNPYAPFLPGSVGGAWTDGTLRGGGSIVVLATGAVTLDGLMDADSNQAVTGNDGRPSGGGIWVCGETVSVGEKAVLRARGAPSTNTGYENPPGAGGRICVCETPSSMWDTFATATEPPADFNAATLVQADASGAYNATRTKKAGDGTAVNMSYMAGKTTLVVESDSVAAIADGVLYGTFFVKCAQELSYSAAPYGRDPEDPDNVRYSLAGWTLTDKDGATAASGQTAPAVFTLAQENGPYTLTWSWTNKEGCHRVIVNGDGTVSADGGEAASELTLWGPASGEGTEVLVATPADGSSFVGWFGIPGGKVDSATVEAPRTVGSCMVAVFAKDEPVLADKTWAGGTTGRWDDPACWNPSGVPTLESDVKVTSGICHVPQGAVAHSVTVSSGATFEIAASKFVDQTIPDTTDRSLVKFLRLAGDFSCAGTALFGAEGAPYTDLCLEIGGDFALTGAASVEVTAMEASEISTNGLYAAATVVRIGGALSVGGTSVLYPRCDGFTGAAVRFEPETLFVAEGAKIQADSLGWKWRAYEGDPDPRAVRSDNTSGSAGFETCAFGAGWSFRAGAGHGAPGNFDTGNEAHAAPEYGFANAPFMPGSPNGIYSSNLGNSGPGGGVIWIKCRGEATINGALTANALMKMFGAPSGGSIWLLTTGLAAGPKAVLSATGGGIDKQNYNAAGSGGRICVALGLADEDVEALAAGEMPAGVTVTEGITLVSATAQGGSQNNPPNGAIRGADGTLVTLSGAHANVTVNVAGDPLQAIGPSPSYGALSFAAGRTVTFRATGESGYGYDPADPENIRYTCAGFVVKDASGAVLTNGTESAFDYVIPEEETTLTWFWTAREAQITAGNPQGETFGTVEIDGESHPSGGSAWGLESDSFVFEAVPAEGYEFLYWAGEFPYGQAKTNSLTLTSDRMRRIWPVFRLAEEPKTRVWRGGKHPVSSTKSPVYPWLDPDNWEPKNIPGLEDDVVFDAAGSTACFMTNNYVEVKSLTVGGDHRLWVGAMSDHAAHQFTQDGFFHTTLTPATEELSLVVAGDVTVSNRAEIAVGSWIQTQAAHTRVLVGGDLTLDGTSMMLVAAGETTEVFTFAHGAGELTVGGTFTVGSAAQLHLSSEHASGGSVVVRADAFVVEEGGLVTATGYGYGNTSETVLDSQAPGFGGEHATAGAGYGGRGLKNFLAAEPQKALSDVYGQTYGFELAPVQPGSNVGNHGDGGGKRGGGLIRVHARAMTLAGSLTADANEKNEFGGASGGGIWLTAKDFTFGVNALLSAHGGKAVASVNKYNSIGGGGRIAIGVGLSDGQIDALAATGKASGLGRKKLAKFLADYPSLDAANVNLEGGEGLDTEKEELKDVKALARGTFRYVKPSGLLLLVK